MPYFLGVHPHSNAKKEATPTEEDDVYCVKSSEFTTYVIRFKSMNDHWAKTGCSVNSKCVPTLLRETNRDVHKP